MLFPHDPWPVVSLPRGDLAAAIFGKIEGNVETIFGDRIHRISQTAKAVDVTFECGGTREFDLVVGADGLHSRVRQPSGERKANLSAISVTRQQRSRSRDTGQEMSWST